MLTVKGKGSQLIATAVLLAFCACGNQSDLQGLQAVPVGQGTPQPRQSGLGEAMEEVQAAPLPAGVDLELWEELKAELARVLSAQGELRLTSAAPAGEQNSIPDLSLSLEDPVSLDWSYVNAGDYDRNGEVSISDLTPVGMHFGARATDPNWDTARVADGDANGEVNISDITPIGQNFFAQVTAYKVYGGYLDYGPWEQLGTAPFDAGEIAGSGIISFEIGLDSHPTYRVVPVDSLGEEGEGGQLAGGSPFNKSLTVTPGEAMLNEITDVLFSIGISGSAGIAPSVELVPLAEDGSPDTALGIFADDGNEAEGDQLAGDGTFSRMEQLTAAEVSLSRFRARLAYESPYGTRSVMSNSAGFLFFDGITIERADEIAAFAAQIQADLDLLSESVPVSEAAQQVLAALNVDAEIPAAGLAENGEGVWWFTQEGLACAATVYEEGMFEEIPEGGVPSSLPKAPSNLYPKTGNAVEFDCNCAEKKLKRVSSAESTRNEINNLNVVFLHAFSPASEYGSMMSRAFAKFITVGCPDFDRKGYYDWDCELEQFRELPEYGVVLIGSYGDAFLKRDPAETPYNPEFFPYPADEAQVAILSTEGASGMKIIEHLPDLKRGRLLLHGKGWLWVLPEFVREYCKNMPNSLVFVSAKKSFYNDTMARAFVDSGAGVYFGLEDGVWRSGWGGVGDFLTQQMIDGKTAAQGYAKEVAPGINQKYRQQLKMHPPGSDLVLGTSEWGICDLGVLYPEILNAYSWGRDVNHYGQVCGETSTPVGGTTGFFWDNGQMVEIDNLGRSTPYAWGMNDLGQVVGGSFLDDRSAHAYRWHRGAGIEDLGTLQGSGNSMAYDINNSGTVVGFSMTPENNQVFQHGFVYSGGTMTEVGGWGPHPFTGNAVEGACVSINEAGLVLGWNIDFEIFSGNKVCFFYELGGEPERLTFNVRAGKWAELGYYYYYGTSLNNKGRVVGSNWIGGDGEENIGSIYVGGFLDAIVYKIGGIEGESPTVRGTDINDAGVVVGTHSAVDGWRGFIYQPGEGFLKRRRWLDDLLPCNSGWYTREASAISNTSYITGNGWHNGESRAFLMYPLDNPPRGVK